MRIANHIMLTLTIAFLMFAGCCPEMHKTLSEQFETQVLYEDFPVSEDNVLVDKEFSPEIINYVESRYENDPEIRALVAIHFLKYDNLSLKIGDITSTGEEMASILYRKEAAERKSIEENANRTYIRLWIDQRKYSVFHLDKYYDGLGIGLLEENEKLFEELSAKWSD